jgi:L-ascorbate metabolism protein UlaG (beta-lactamase superfamily)
VQLRYLGTAGLVVETAQHTVVMDPFISRPGLLATAFRPLVPDLEAIRRKIPRADDVLIGHAHHDHVLDGPDLCRMTGARFIGAPDACNVARAAGLPESQLVETMGREEIDLGSGRVRGLPSQHGKVIFGKVINPGHISSPPPWPPRLRDLKHGLVLNWWLELGGARIVHIDSADYFDEELEGLGADVVCLCAVGRQFRPGYVQGVVERLQPQVIIPCHWDWFFTPYDSHPRELPGVDVEGFMDEIRSFGVRPVLLPFDGVMGFTPRGDRGNPAMASSTGPPVKGSST